jgi:hypothetical protein
MPKVVKVEKRWGRCAKTDRTSGMIDKISEKTVETCERIAVTCVKIDESYVTTDGPVPVRENWHRTGVTSDKINATCGGTIEICDTIVRTVTMTAETCGTIWAVEGTAVASRGLDTTEPAKAPVSADSSVWSKHPRVSR